MHCLRARHRHRVSSMPFGMGGHHAKMRYSTSRSPVTVFPCGRTEIIGPLVGTNAGCLYVGPSLTLCKSCKALSCIDRLRAPCLRPIDMSVHNCNLLTHYCSRPCRRGNVRRRRVRPSRMPYYRVIDENSSWARKMALRKPTDTDRCIVTLSGTAPSYCRRRVTPNKKVGCKIYYAHPGEMESLNKLDWLPLCLM